MMKDQTLNSRNTFWNESLDFPNFHSLLLFTHVQNLMGTNLSYLKVLFGLWHEKSVKINNKPVLAVFSIWVINIPFWATLIPNLCTKYERNLLKDAYSIVVTHIYNVFWGQDRCSFRTTGPRSRRDCRSNSSFFLRKYSNNITGYLLGIMDASLSLHIGVWFHTTESSSVTLCRSHLSVCSLWILFNSLVPTV